MEKKEKTRLFESEALILPALKMILIENNEDSNVQSVKKAKKKDERDFNEEIVMRIIGKLSMKE